MTYFKNTDKLHGESQEHLALFNIMIKNDYTNIHGTDTLSKLFDNLKEEDLNILIDLYTRFPLLRMNKISNYLNTQGLMPCDLDSIFVIRMYVNALQHFIHR